MRIVKPGVFGTVTWFFQMALVHESTDLDADLRRLLVFV